jgi:hypothetical protein
MSGEWGGGHVNIRCYIRCRTCVDTTQQGSRKNRRRRALVRDSAASLGLGAHVGLHLLIQLLLGGRWSFLCAAAAPPPAAAAAATSASTGGTLRLADSAATGSATAA